MKPRTKLQVRILQLSNQLPELSQEQKEWAFKNCLLHIGYRSKKHIACLDCGHVWDGPKIVKSSICPECGAKLKIENTRKKKLDQRKYLSILDVKEEFQVVRLFEIFAYHKAGEKPRIWLWEVIQQFFTPDGKLNVVARNRTWTFYIDSFNGDLEIRTTHDRWGNQTKYDLWPDKIYPKVKCLPVFVRNGYKTKVDGISPYCIFKAILNDNIAETLLKAKQFALLAAKVGSREWDVRKHWSSVKICLRSNYVIKEDQATTWLDYLDLLVYFKKDLRNASFVCPKNLKREHDKLVAKKTEIMDHERYMHLLGDMGKDVAPFKNLSAAGLKAEYDKARYTRLLIGFGKAEATLLNRTAADLQMEYDRLCAEKNAKENREREARELERKKKQFLEDQKSYDKHKKVFFGLVFCKGDITIKVLESIQEFLEEAEAHGHCVFSNNYHKREDSLILSAKVDGKPAETIEIQLSKMSIVQSRGLGNNASKHNEQILKLLKKNMPAIRKRYKNLKSVAA